MPNNKDKISKGNSKSNFKTKLNPLVELLKDSEIKSSNTPENKQKNVLLQYGDEDLIKDLRKSTGSRLEKGVYSPQLDELMRLEGNPTILDSDMDYTGMLSAAQPFSEQLGNVFKGGFYGAVAGLLSSFDYDIPDIVDMYKGRERKYGNWLHDISQGMQKKMNDYPIYMDGSSFGDPAYWLTQLQNQGFTLGLVGGTFLQQAALSALTEATFGSTAWLQELQASRAFRLLSQFAFGSTQGIQEAYINALDTARTTKQDYLKMGYSEEEADKQAGKAAALGFRMESGPLMILNGLQFGMIGKYNPFSMAEKGLNSGFSGAVEGLGDILFKNVKHEATKKALEIGVNTLSESLEEFIQTGISNYAQYKTEVQSGDLFSNFKLWNQNMTDSVIGGALGGLIFSGMGELRNHIEKSNIHRRYGKLHDEFLAKANIIAAEDLMDLKKAVEEGDEKEIRKVRYRMQKDNVYQALQLDFLNKKETAFGTYVSSLKEILDAANNKDVKKLEELGIKNPGEQDIAYIKENYPGFIEDAFDIKEGVVKNLEKTRDLTASLYLTDAEQVLKQAEKYKAKDEAEVSQYYAKNPIYQNLSPEAKTKFALLAEREALMERSLKKLTKEQKRRKNAIETEINNIKLSEKEENLIKGISSYVFKEKEANKLEFEEMQEKALQLIKYWSKEENRRKERKKAAEEALKKANSASDVKETVENLEKNGQVNNEIKEKAKDKIADEEIKNPDNTPVVFFDDVVSETEAEIAERDKNTNPQRQNLASEIVADLTPIAEEIPDVPPEVIKKKGVKPPEVPPEVLAQEAAENSKKSTKKPVEETPPGDYTKINEPGLFSLPGGELNDKQLQKLKNLVAQYYENLKDELGREPTFKEFVKDFIKHTSKEDAKKLYNSLAKGWEANDLTPADYAKVYDELFKNRKVLASEILELFNEEAPTVEEDEEPSTDTQLKESNEEDLKNSIELSGAVVGFDENNRPIIKDDSFRAVSAKLRAAFLGILYERKIVRNEDGSVSIVDTDIESEINKSAYVDNRIPLDPDALNPGTRLMVAIPENYKDVLVTTWKSDYEKASAIPFGEIEKEAGEERWLDKVPMVVYTADGRHAFLIHDTDWYNRANTGFKDNPAKQQKLINDAREKLREFRREVYENYKRGKGTQIEITDKRPGAWKTIDEGEKPLTLNEANPQTILAVANSNGDLLVNGKTPLKKKGITLVNKKQDVGKSGHVYELRRATQTGQYVALKAKRNTLSPAIQKTLQTLLEEYVRRGNTQLKDKIWNIMKLDIHDNKDFLKILQHFIKPIYSKANNNIDLMRDIASSDIKEGEPFIMFNGDTLVFGIKGKNFYEGKSYIRLYPGQYAKNKDFFEFLLTKLPEVLSGMTQNVFFDGLAENRTLFTIEENNSVVPQKSYQEYLKDNLTTTIRSFNIGTEEKPNYITYVQPVIEYKSVAEEPFDIGKEYQNFVETGKVSPEVVEYISNKIENGQTLTAEEEALRQGAAKEVENKLKEFAKNEEVKKEAWQMTKKEFVDKENKKEEQRLKDIKQELSKTPKELTNEIEEQQKYLATVIDKYKGKNKNPDLYEQRLKAANQLADIQKEHQFSTTDEISDFLFDNREKYPEAFEHHTFILFFRNSGGENVADPIKEHSRLVRQALENGKPVSEEVLKDYKGEKWADEALNKLQTPTTKTEIPEINLEENPAIAHKIFKALGLNVINGKEIEYKNEKGEICAKCGLTNTVSGTGWKIVKDFKGKPKHSQGGVDITISNKGVTMRRGGKDIKAAHGLLLPFEDIQKKAETEDNPILNSIYKKYPAFKNMGKIVLKADKTFTRDKTQVGDIEFFDSENLEDNTITYNNGYKVKNPNPNGLGIIYNPDNNDEQNIMLDMLHGMVKDKVYAKHREEFKKAFFNSVFKEDYEREWRQYNKETKGNNDGEQKFRDNWIDSKIRNLMFEGTDEDFEKSRYWKDARKVYFQDKNIKKTYQQLYNYLQTGKGYTLPEVEITPNKK